MKPARDLPTRDFTSVDLTKAHLGAMEAARALNAYVLETPDKALEMAAASDARRAKGEAGRLEGIPLGIKDLFATEGTRTTACSKILGQLHPAVRIDRHAPALARWRGDARQAQQR